MANGYGLSRALIFSSNSLKSNFFAAGAVVSVADAPHLGQVVAFSGISLPHFLQFMVSPDGKSLLLSGIAIKRNSYRKKKIPDDPALPTEFFPYHFSFPDTENASLTETSPDK